MRLSLDDSSDLAFVLWAFASDSISRAEFAMWVDHVIQNEPNPPSYIFDLMDFKGSQMEIPKIIGFVPEWEPTSEEYDALHGLAIERGRKPLECGDAKSCLAAASRLDAIRKRYFHLMPFLDRAKM
jgi:hypothetical protein